MKDIITSNNKIFNTRTGTITVCEYNDDADSADIFQFGGVAKTQMVIIQSETSPMSDEITVTWPTHAQSSECDLTNVVTADSSITSSITDTSSVANTYTFMMNR